jgi:YHS domain-containing protein
VGILVRILLLFILAMLVARAFWRLIAGIIVGASLPPSASRQKPGVPARGVQMVRDPVCGAFLLPGNAVSAAGRGGAVHYFCSETCRRRFQDDKAAVRRS